MPNAKCWKCKADWDACLFSQWLQTILLLMDYHFQAFPWGPERFMYNNTMEEGIYRSSEKWIPFYFLSFWLLIHEGFQCELLHYRHEINLSCSVRKGTLDLWWYQLKAGDQTERERERRHHAILGVNQNLLLLLLDCAFEAAALFSHLIMKLFWWSSLWFCGCVISHWALVEVIR